MSLVIGKLIVELKQGEPCFTVAIDASADATSEEIRAMNAELAHAGARISVDYVSRSDHMPNTALCLSSCLRNQTVDEVPS